MCAVPHRRGLRITTWRIIVLALLNTTILVHYYFWHVLEMREVGHSDPREFFEFFRTGIIRPFAVVFLIVAILTLFIGRSFCGWFCHMGSWQDAARFAMDRKWRWLRPLHGAGTLLLPALCLLLPFIGIAVVWIQGGPPTAFEFAWSDIPVLDITASELLISLVLLVVINQALFGARAICRFFCPLGLWLKFFDLFSRMRIRRTGNSLCAASCLQCNQHCRMGVDVNYQTARFGEVKDLQCVKCGTCTVSCPQEKLRLTRQPLAVEVVLDPGAAPNPQPWIKKPFITRRKMVLS